MENQRSLNFSCCYQRKDIEEVQQALILTGIELEATRAAAQDELRKRDEQLFQLKGLLNLVIRDRDYAFQKCRKHATDGGLSSSSDCEDSIVSSPPLPETSLRLLAAEKPLPVKGKLLEAVMKAGPLLQTLLLAGPLPQWRYPPPPLESAQIPLVEIPAINSPGIVHREVIPVNPTSSCGIMINRKRKRGS